MKDNKKVAIDRFRDFSQKQNTRKSKRKLNIYAIAIPVLVAVALLILGILFIPPLFDSSIDTAKASPTISNQLSAENPIESDAAQFIVYGNEEGLDEEVPNDGEFMLSGGVSAALRDPSNNSALFSVALDCYSSDDQAFYESFSYEGKTRKEWGQIPEVIEYQKGFSEFSRDVESKTDWDSIKTSEDKEKYLLSIVQQWDNIWNETHDINPSTKKKEAEQAYMEARKDRKYNRSVAEVERMSVLGLDVKLEKTIYGDYYITALLTKEQIEEFSCGDYGYVIRWAYKADSVDE